MHRKPYFSKKCKYTSFLLTHLYILVHRIASIILSRFILDLRQNGAESSTMYPSQSTVEFAQRVEDGLGGSSNSLWGSGTDEDQSEHEDCFALGYATDQSTEE